MPLHNSYINLLNEPNESINEVVICIHLDIDILFGRVGIECEYDKRYKL